MKMHHGLAFPDADVFMAAQVGSDGRYQGDHLDAALRHVSDFSVAIDGGAHVGTWSRLMAERFDRVIAAEPSADTFEALQHNMQMLGRHNVETRQVALGSAPSRVGMALDEKGTLLANTGARFVRIGLPGEPALTPMVTIDGWELPSLGFVKLDIEGSEYMALMGARATLIRCRPVVLFEEKGFGTRFGGGRGECAAFLKTLGYQQLAVISSDQIWGPA